MKLLQLIGTALPNSSESTLAPSRFTGRLVAGILALSLIVVMLVALTLYESRQQHEKQAVVTVQNLSGLLEHDLAASFDKIDLTLLALADEVNRLRRSGNLDASGLNAFIARQVARLPELSGLRMSDVHGDLRYGTALPPGAPVNIADREFFIRLRDHPDAGLVITKPLVGRITGKWQIYLTRRLNQPDGSFAGTVVAAIELSQLTARFAALKIGRGGVIVLRDHELDLVVRHPELENDKSPIGQKNLSREFEGQFRITPEAGVFHAIAPVDHLERTFSYRKVTSYPFYIFVGLATDDFLDEWWKEVAKNGILLAIFMLITLGFSWLVLRAWKHREADLAVIRQKEQKFRTLLELSPDPLVIADAKGLITLINRQAVALFGYEPGELVGQPVEVLLPQRYRGDHVVLRQCYTQTPQAREMGKERLLSAVTKQGREVPVHVNLSPIQTEQGLMVAAAIRDISERQAAEAKIKRLTDLYAALNQCSQAIVRCTSEDELFRQVCRAAVEFGGMKMARIDLLDEASQKVKPVAWYGTDTDYLEGLQISVNADEPAGRGGTGTAIRENRPVWIQDFQNDPSLAPWHERAARAGWRATAALPLLRHGKVIGAFRLHAGKVNAFDEAARNLLMEMAVDIGHALDHYSLLAAQKQAEEALRIAAAAFESQEGMMITDANNVILRVNRAFTEITGYTAEDAVGQTPRLLQSDRHDEVFFAGILECIKHTGSWHGEFWGRRKNGESYPQWLTITAVKSADGTVTHYVYTEVDITNRKLIETKLNAAKAEADHANRSKSRFLAAASHDLRQPVFAMSLFVGLLKNKVSPDSLELVNNLQDCVDSMGKLLIDLLDVSKLDAGVVTPKLSDFAVDDLLGTLVTIHSPEAQQKGLCLRWRRSGLVAYSDQQMLGRIIGNFVSNAVRHTDKGGVLIACRHYAGKPWVEVWDTGIGIPESKTDIIFDEFRQLDDGVRTRGSGLGLTIAAKMAAMLGLKIRMRSRPGRGSMFAIELTEGRMIKADERPTTRAAARALRIGLVEDNTKVLLALVLALESLGHEVISATTGRELIERLGHRAPDIVISDYRLATAETGFDVIEATREVFGNDLPAILITGDTDPVLIRAMADRDIAVLYKPIQIDQLQTFILDSTRTCHEIVPASGR